MNKRLECLVEKTEALDGKMMQLAWAFCDLNGDLGNPLGVMDEDSEIGVERTNWDDEDEYGEPLDDELLSRIEIRLQELEIQAQKLTEVARDLNEYMGNPVGAFNRSPEIVELVRRE
ncbi:MAG: hypothetical protein OXC65_01485 [Thiotrichales bacterium]|nr:hypothetical protein [Thiotrichales bacterium]MCY4283994.1 hypothetical protein [Thiotrichales bacterium]